MLVILFPVHLPPPILISLGDSETRARQMHDDLADSIVVMPDRNVVAVRMHQANAAAGLRWPKIAIIAAAISRTAAIISAGP